MYIFLDVDGVLNTEADWTRRVYSLNQSCINAFCRLLKSIPDPKIVLSSTWRNGIARDGSTAVHVDDLKRALEPTYTNVLDKTAVSPDGSRSKEIDLYLRRHPQDTYLILDDDQTLFSQGAKTAHLYLTDSKTGITDKDIINIIKRYL